VTIFLGCGFAAKYREGGGNFSVPLQWMLGLRRLKLDAVWLEHLPATENQQFDRANIDNFRRRLQEHGLAGNYCLLYQDPANDEQSLATMRCVGMSRSALLDRLAGPNVLLNLSYSIHPPFLLRFERRIFCDLDPSEIFYWMTRLEIGLNVGGHDCRLPKNSLKWKTFYPLADTQLLRRQPRPRTAKFSTIGQWYWSGMVEVEGQFPDLSKKVAFEPYLELPRKVPEAQFELAMNINRDDPERLRLRKCGWHIVDPHRVALTPRRYRRYLSDALGEFTAIKGVDVSWKTGWLSDRAAAFLALGRPVITEDTEARKFLPSECGFDFVTDINEAVDAVRGVMANWSRRSKEARECAVEVFDSVKNLRKILGL
jgi:hypothetical protein